MDEYIDHYSNVLAEWAAKERYVCRVLIYGSRVGTGFKPNSDLDIAVQIEGFPDKLSYFETCKDYWTETLSRELGVNAHLEWYEPKKTTHVQEGLDAGHQVAFEH